MEDDEFVRYDCGLHVYIIGWKGGRHLGSNRMLDLAESESLLTYIRLARALAGEWHDEKPRTLSKSKNKDKS